MNNNTLVHYNIEASPWENGVSAIFYINSSGERFLNSTIAWKW